MIFYSHDMKQDKIFKYDTETSDLLEKFIVPVGDINWKIQIYRSKLNPEFYWAVEKQLNVDTWQIICPHTVSVINYLLEHNLNDLLNKYFEAKITEV